MPLAFYVLLAGFGWLALVFICMVVAEQGRQMGDRKNKAQQADHVHTEQKAA